MHLSIASNYVAGVYTVFELIVAIAVVRSATTIASCLNVHTIYDKRQVLPLSHSHLTDIFVPILGSRWTHIWTASLLSLVVVLTTIGGFSIVGVTEERSRAMKVRYLVQPAPDNYTLDVADRFAVKDGIITVYGRVMLHDAYGGCMRRNGDRKIVSEYFYNGEDIDAVKWSPRASLNITCLARNPQFQDRIAIDYNWPPRDMLSDCSWTGVNTEKSEINALTKGSVEQNGDCTAQVKEMWCFRTIYRLYCAASLEDSGGYGAATYVANEDFGVSLKHTTFPEAPGTEKLQAMALLLRSHFGDSPSHLLFMLSLRVQEDGYVMRVEETRPATEIKLPLLLAVTVPAVVMTVLACTVALILWVRVIVVPGRLRYNRFCSELDLLSCAAVEKFRDGGCRFRRSMITLAVQSDCRYAGPVQFDSTEKK